MSEAEAIAFEHEGAALGGFVVRPDHGGETSPAVIMFPGATGPGPTFRATAHELARIGYIAVGADMYGTDADISTAEAAGQHFAALLQEPEKLRRRTVAWVDAVKALHGVNPARVAAIGYCFGGKCVLEIARSGTELCAVVSYHGLLTTHAPARSGEVRTQVAIWTGGRDPYAPLAEYDAVRREFEIAGANFHLTLFSHAEHSFTDPDHHGILPGIAYDPMSHKVSWAGTLAMLEQAFG